MLLTLCLGDGLDTKQKQIIVQNLYLEHIGRILGNDPKVLDWFIVSQQAEDNDTELQLADLDIDVALFYTEYAVRKAVRKALPKLSMKVQDTSQVLIQPHHSHALRLIGVYQEAKGGMEMIAC